MIDGRAIAQVHIGCSGFNYKHWRGSFYPEKLPQRLWFSHYFSVFSTVELNVTFYRLPQLSVFQHCFGLCSFASMANYLLLN